MLQGYEDDPEPEEEDEEDASYADEEYGTSKKKAPKKKKQPSKPRGSFFHPFNVRNVYPIPQLTSCLLVSTRHSPSDSDSDYGSKSKKKKKPRVPSDEIRVSSRGTRVPNYVDDVQDFEQFDDDEPDAGVYGEPAVLKEEDEIEMVLSHARADEFLSDPEDNWYTNIVRGLFFVACMCLTRHYRDFISSGRTSRIFIIRTRCTSSLNVSVASSA